MTAPGPSNVSPIPVLVTGAGTVTSQGVMKALRSQFEVPVCIVATDIYETAAGRYFSDYFHRVPRGDDPAYAESMLELCREHGIRLLIPIVDEEFPTLSAAADRFADVGCFLAMSPRPVIELTADKLQAYRFLRERAFDCATSWSADEALDAIDRLPFPLFVKPSRGARASVDCYRVDTRSDLETILPRVASPMVQELIEAPELTVDVLVDPNGSAMGIVVRERLETKGGVSYKGRTVQDDLIESEVVRLVAALKVRGPANIQVFRTADRVVINEINPRFSGGLALSLAAGLNGPLMLVKMAMGWPVGSVLDRTEIGLTMLRYWDEVFVAFDGVARFPNYRLKPS
jgi:carbamoyl-phosphate synthase large subunit